MSWLRVVMTGLLLQRRPVFDTRTFGVNFVFEAVTQHRGLAVYLVFLLSGSLC